MMWRALLLSSSLLAAGCTGGKTEGAHATSTFGSSRRGARIVQDIGCPACHTIPGVRFPRGTVGPSLQRFGDRTFIAGLVPNTPENLKQWVMNPQSLEPRTAMPNLGLTDSQAQDVVAYLYTLD
jgi:cytochrome c